MEFQKYDVKEKKKEKKEKISKHRSLTRLEKNLNHVMF